MSAGLKVCGITRAADLDLCTELGVAAVGLNLWSGSKRGLSLEQAKAVVHGASGSRAVGPRRVGVFVHHDAASIEAAFRALELDAIQVHDDRPAADVAALGLPWIWVIRGTPELATLQVPAFAPRWILLDACVAGFGGQGHRTDWVWARAAVQRLAPLPVWLAGGIRPDNAAAALEAVCPAGLDVASGVERADGPAGAKDRARVAAIQQICADWP